LRIVSGVSEWLLNVIKRVRGLSGRQQLAGLGGVVLLAVSCGAWIMHDSAAQNAAERTRQAQQAAAVQRLNDELQAKKAKATASNSATTNAPSTPAPTTPSTPAAPKTASGIKYSTSSDPRSTAYSTTPPAPHPASFEIKITRNGQVAPGTLISYNATKGEKAYYGGDLVVSQLSITLSKSGYNGPSRPPFVISSPDGAIITRPHTPWDDHSSIVFEAMDLSKVKGDSNTYEMFIDHSSDPPLGTYPLHLTVSRIGQAADAWYYDVFLTVQIVE
jgi:hypothetical protein